MKLYEGQQGEYKKSHDNIWPELVTLLSDAGISNYCIFLEEKSNTLFATFEYDNLEKVDNLVLMPVMQKWWAYMKDIMDTNEDNSPVAFPLKQVFYMQ